VTPQIACPPGTEFRHTLTIFCNQGPKVRERISLLQLLILNEYAIRYAVACHYVGLVDVLYVCVINLASWQRYTSKRTYLLESQVCADI